MKLRKWLKGSCFLNASILALTGMLLLGCETTAPRNNNGYVPPTEPNSKNTEEPTNKLRVNDTVRVDFSNVSDRLIAPHEEQIKEDGTITLFLVGPIKAAGKTTGELQNELQEKYRKYYVAMTVTVKAPDRFYSVGGEVRTPKRDVYLGGTTVIKAIQSAGDFTEFANRRKVQLTRANGKTYTVDCEKALKNPEFDLPVYPGDSIHVPRRFF